MQVALTFVMREDDEISDEDRISAVELVTHFTNNSTRLALLKKSGAEQAIINVIKKRLAPKL